MLCVTQKQYSHTKKVHAYSFTLFFYKSICCHFPPVIFEHPNVSMFYYVITSCQCFPLVENAHNSNKPCSWRRIYCKTLLFIMSKPVVSASHFVHQIWSSCNHACQHWYSHFYLGTGFLKLIHHVLNIFHAHLIHNLVHNDKYIIC